MHYEYAQEEWLIVLDGRPSLRHPDGTDQLEPWDVARATSPAARMRCATTPRRPCAP